jgi:hypothetical protein
MADDDQIRTIVAEMKDLTAKEVARVAFAVHARLIQTTPVDTGWARANWVVTIGEPWEDLVGDEKQARRGDIDTITGLQSSSRLFSYDLAMGDVFISNNVPYIQRLNEGYSQQAPSGFVEAAVEAGIAAGRGQ